MLGLPPAVTPHIRRFGFSGLAVVILIILMIFGINPITVLTGQVAKPNPYTTLEALAAVKAGTAKPSELVEAVDREADTFWERAFRQSSIQYPPVSVKMVADARELGCGMAGSNLGTFYCPSEAVTYVDMDHYGDLVAQFPGQGHEAETYLINRAFGHHVQHALRLWLDEPAPSAAEEPNSAIQAACYTGAGTKAAGLPELLDDPAVVAAIAFQAAEPMTVAPSRAADPVPETLAQPPFDALKRGFDAGYAIPAPGTCRMEKLLGSS